MGLDDHQIAELNVLFSCNYQTKSFPLQMRNISTKTWIGIVQKFYITFINLNFLITFTLDAFISFISSLLDYIVRKIDQNVCLFNFLSYLNTSSILNYKIC